ncbi:hypothetical protein, partial [uncultured Bifidobacterium sp.]|uniref:hypothetical protein n=1 Tax=uncultured Bifidobacterium sp. TaxID=165187 RepID=UPI002601DD7E
MGMRFLDVSTNHPPEPRFMRLVGPVGHETLHGRLGRDVYIAYDAADPTGSHASLVGRHRTHTAQQTLCALEGDPRLWKSLVVHAERRSRDVFALKVARDLGAG